MTVDIKSEERQCRYLKSDEQNGVKKTGVTASFNLEKARLNVSKL